MGQEKNILELLPSAEILGKPDGKSLWTIVFIDEDDVEDSQTELWRADHHDQLASLALEHYVGENADEDDEDPMAGAIAQEFRNNWGVTILPTKIGRLDKGKAKKK